MLQNLEIILSPAVYSYHATKGNHVTVVIDVLRFTTSLVSVFENGAISVIPVSLPDEAEALQKQGFPVAAEREGIRLPFADYGNSAADFRTADIKGKTLVYSTTNGTKAMKMAAEHGLVVTAAFTNLTAVADWLVCRNENLIILCSGWKNLISMEDTICAGALADLLLKSGRFQKTGDEVDLALTLWESNRNKLKEALMSTSHYIRLLGLSVDPLADHTVSIGISQVVPVFENGKITNKSKY
ncbi:MAG: 2-phosphosulfolactate phosphatase [Lentimicrobium sp.]|nr:2-phosphosulfolactate phosphatase [Lentimicrobium sp.]